MILLDKNNNCIYNLDNFIEIYVSEDKLHRLVVAGHGVDNCRYILVVCKTENLANELITTIYEAISTGAKTIVLDNKQTGDGTDLKGDNV